MDIVIDGATVFTATGALLEDSFVLVADGRIAAAGRDVPHPPGATVVDAAGQFLMPGFIDAHCHLTYALVPERPEPHPDVPFLGARAARLQLASGVTTVRDLGGNNYVDLALGRAIERGDVPGPHVVAAGKAIASTGGHVHYWAREADGPDEIRKAVREQVRAGAEVIKLMVSGGAANVGERPDAMQLQPDELRAAVREANEAGRKVAMHAHPSRAIQAAVQAGAASIEHGMGLDDAAIEAVLEHDVWVVPTQAVYRRIADNVDGWPRAKADIAKRILESKVPNLRRAVEAGVKIGVGTDPGRHLPHGEIVGEMLALQEAGLTPEQVLFAATRGNAELLGLSDEIGTIEVGKRADLVLLAADPRDDLEHARHVRGIVVHGRIWSPEALQSVDRQART